MQQGLMILPVLIPVIFWALYHYHKDRHLPEPPGKLLICLGLGVLAYFLSGWGYALLQTAGLRQDAVWLALTDPGGLFAYSMLAIGPIEELGKLLLFVLVVLRFREFDEPMDGIIYASFIGLGFAAAENVYYLQYLTPLESIARGFAGPVVHMLFASIWGYWIGMAFLERRSVIKAGVAAFIVAAGLHGLYDFIVLLNPTHALPIAAALIIAMWIWRLKLLHVLHLDAVQEARAPERE